MVKHSSISFHFRPEIAELERSLPILFSQTYPQVLIQGNGLEKVKIYVNEKTMEITGLDNWSEARVAPFGAELVLNAFWDEFWARCGIDDDIRQLEVRTMAMQAAKIQAVQRYAFESEGKVATSEDKLKMLDAFIKY
ncbi:hypothetical protein BBP40_008744 [Aspergillus hancockii]|nr:hypothetical protein BBP40_008744 [Aspergillus hancockii]